MTPHINANSGDFAEICLLPGDPLRAKYIAYKFLSNAKLITDVRGMLGFTGKYRGIAVSTMGAGMGMPSATIYYTEIIKYYGVKQLIRVGSCGGISEAVNLRDIVIGMGSCTDSKTNRIRFGGHDFAAIADFGLLAKTVDTAKKLNTNIKIGNLFSSDDFYSVEPEFFTTMARMGVLGVEMEASALYRVCAEYKVQGLAICTVSDHIPRQEALSTTERTTSFDTMIELALETII
jgi:purine-nucleoside phosphorylase